MNQALVSPDSSPARSAGMRQRSQRAVIAWLLVCAALVATMIVVGGVTRLTRSGLSIVEWRPIAGAIPPLSQADWLDAFDKYRQTPEYKVVNQGMSLAEFKAIFWWEYVHRLLGRVIGAAFLLPLLTFSWRGRIGRPLGWKLASVFLLGAIQGALGWYMVASGLVDEPRVSHLRLTAHLGLAFLILGGILWIALDLLFPNNRSEGRTLSRFGAAIAALVFAQVLAGALVAGLRAGKAYNTFPLMNGHVAPPETMLLEPWWLNFFNNMATVQLDHRLLAWLLLLLVPWLWLRIRRSVASPRARLGAHGLLALLVVQFTLGVATLLTGAPVGLAIAHQAVATLVFCAALFTAHALRSPR